MPLLDLRKRPRIAVMGHLAGFLAASFLITRLGQATGLTPFPGQSALDAAVGLPLPIPPESAGEWALALMRWAIIPAAMEELFFRGLIFEVVRRMRGDTAALFVSTALFALAHPGPAHLAAASLLGLYLGTLRLRWGLALPVAAHGINNALALHFGPTGMPGALPRGSALSDPLLWLAMALVGSSVAVLRQEIRSGASAHSTQKRRSLQQKPLQDE